MRKTKIICTIGPASENEETLREMCLAGMNVARLNFSHGPHPEQLARIERIKKLREELDMPIAIMLDTKGPEYRIRTFENGQVTLKEGQEFTFTTEEIVGDEYRVSVSYKNLMNDLEPGDTVLLSNGMLTLRVNEVTATEAHCTVLVGGLLGDKKSMNFPGKVLSQPYLSEQDRKDIIFGIEHGVDFIACSFVSRKEDLLDIKALLAEYGAKDIELIAKIENSTGIANIDEICKECSGIMIGRGDLGVEIPLEELPAVQKRLITKCRMLGKRVITATEMLESMIHSARPTRAEASDVANAVYDGTSAIMLSGETAMGDHPVLVLKTMARIAEYTEEHIHYAKRFHKSGFEIRDLVDAISHAVAGMSIDTDSKAICVCTHSGMTARMVSRFRTPVDILGVTDSESTWRRLALSWGVTPVRCETYDSNEVLFYTAKKIAVRKFGLKSGDHLILTGGIKNGRSDSTNLIKVETV